MDRQEQRAKVAAFQRQHRVALLTLLFTDMVGSTQLKEQLGDFDAVELLHRHHELVRQILAQFLEAEEIERAGDSFFIGFGEVWLGRHQTLKERRVFKFCFRADRVRPFKREVTLFRLLKERIGRHPNIVGVQEVNFTDPPYYLVMDYSASRDLRSWLEAQGGLDQVPLAARLEIVAQAAEALEAAHAAGVIHRDVKPSNILVTGQRVPGAGHQEPVGPAAALGSSPPLASGPPLQVRLTDFGIGQVVSAEALAGLTKMGFTQTLISPGSSSQTGTLLYLAPELIAGHPATKQSDIYSLGVVLYQLALGDLTRPVTPDWSKHINDPILREDLERCFPGNPAERFGSAGELAGRLRSLEARRQERAAAQAAAVAREDAECRRALVRTGLIVSFIVVASFLLVLSQFYQFSVTAHTVYWQSEILLLALALGTWSRPSPRLPGRI